MVKYKHSGSQPKTINVEAASNSKALKYGYREVKTTKKKPTKIQNPLAKKSLDSPTFSTQLIWCT
jgi:hypothetical protein